MTIRDGEEPRAVGRPGRSAVARLLARAVRPRRGGKPTNESRESAPGDLRRSKPHPPQPPVQFQLDDPKELDAGTQHDRGRRQVIRDMILSQGTLDDVGSRWEAGSTNVVLETYQGHKAGTLEARPNRTYGDPFCIG
jgi:hypothetical protein